MRSLFSFFFCFYAVSAHSQNAHIDTFDLKRSEFIKFHWTDTNIVDTLLNTNDSLIIRFRNQQDYIRQKIDIKNDTGCIRESWINYIDTNNLVIYSEHWSFDCQNIDHNDYYGLLDTYRRFLYDSKKRKISEFVYNSSTGAWRYDHMYNDKEKQNSKSTKVTRNQFWTDGCR